MDALKASATVPTRPKPTLTARVPRMAMTIMGSE